MRGRKPDALAVRRKTSTADLATATTIDVDDMQLVEPAEIAADPHMHEIWETTVGSGAAFDACDAPVVQQLVFNIAILEDCRAHIYKSEGGMQTLIEESDEHGVKLKQNPYMRVMWDAEKSVLKLAQELGISRFARARLGLTKAMGTAAQLSIAEQIDRAISGRK